MSSKSEISKKYTSAPIFTSTNYYRGEANEELKFCYSRDSNPNTALLEAKLGEIFTSEVVSYSSGSAAILAVFFLHKPTRVWVEHLYVDAISTFQFISQIFSIEIKVLPKPSEFQLSNLHTQDKTKELIWVELVSLSTRKLSGYYEMIKSGMLCGYKVAVDASYCPPPFCFPLKHGFDAAVYSKPDIILGPHGPSSGYVAIGSSKEAEKLLLDRTDMGPVLGNLDAWNSVRCLKTYVLRSQSQSDTTRKVLEWLKEESLAVIKDINTCDVCTMGSYLPPVISIQFFNNEVAKEASSMFNLHSSRGNYFRNVSKLVLSLHEPSDVGLCHLDIGLEDFDILKSTLVLTFNDLSHHDKTLNY